MFGKKGKYPAVTTEAAVKYKKKSQKSNLLSAYFTSLLCLILCATMFLSTSMAWFTSEVNNAGNEIYVGMLDVKLLHADGVDNEGKMNWVDLEAEANKDHKILDSKVFWAPETLQVERLQVTNSGNLAFNYRLFMSIEHTDYAKNDEDDNATAETKESEIAKAMKAAEYITVWVKTVDENYTEPTNLAALSGNESGWNAVGTLADVFAGQIVFQGSMGNNEVAAVDQSGTVVSSPTTHEYAIALHMAVDAPVEIMGAKLSGINIKLVAAQVASNTSDVSVVSTAQELATAMAKNGTVILVNNIVLTETVNVPAETNVTLDLNGHTISQKKAQTEAYSMILNKGTLTIKDSVGSGLISYADTTVYSANVNHASNTIRNEGTLNIEGGTIENISSDNVQNHGYPHAIDVYSGSVTNISGGTVKSANYDAIRMFCNSADKAATVNISGGTIINRVTFQHPSKNIAANGVLNITGGTFISTTGKANVRLLAFGADYTNMKTNISGGEFDQGIGISDYTEPDIVVSWVFDSKPAAQLVGDLILIEDNDKWIVSEKTATENTNTEETTP